MIIVWKNKSKESKNKNEHVQKKIGNKIRNIAHNILLFVINEICFLVFFYSSNLHRF